MIESFISIDLETTGLNQKKDAIMEIGAVKYRNGTEADSFHRMVDPGRLIPKRVTELTGITQEEISGKECFCEIGKELLEFLEDDILVGHNILFDYSFLKRAFVNDNLVTNKGTDTFEKKGIDTLKISRLRLSELESRSLTSLCEYYKIKFRAHRAIEDARATAELFLILQKNFPECSGLKPLPLKYKVKKEGPLTPAQKERLYMLIEQHKINTEYDVERMTKNEASRYLDQILAKYGRSNSSSQN